MRYQISVLCLLLLCICSVIQGQQREQQQKPNYVNVPSETVLLVVASQPECPLQIEDAKLFVSVKPGDMPLYQYQLHNRGTKPIRYYTIGAWSSNGTGSTLGDGRITDSVIMSGQTVSPTEGKLVPEIIPLTDDVRAKLRLPGPMQAVIILMVESITFADGSTYRDEATSKALRNYFRDLGE